MWLVITEDAGTARTLADHLGDGKHSGYTGGHAPVVTYSGARDRGAVVAIGGPLLRPTLHGRGHPGRRDLRWTLTGKAATAAVRRLAAGTTHVAVATAGTPAGELAALQALRVVAEEAPRAARRARRLNETGEAGGVWEHARGSAAQASVAIDVHWGTLLAPVAPGAGVHTLPTLAMLAGSPTPVETAVSGLRSVGLCPTGIGELELHGLVWCDDHVHLAPAGALLVADILARAPGLLETGVALEVRAAVEQVHACVLTPERAIERARQLLCEIAPMELVEAPVAFTQGRVLGRCPSCDLPMRPVRRLDGRLRLACAGGDTGGCGLAYPLPTEAVAHPGGAPCECGAPRLRVHLRGWLSKPRCAAGDECTLAVNT